MYNHRTVGKLILKHTLVSLITHSHLLPPFRVFTHLVEITVIIIQMRNHVARLAQLGHCIIVTRGCREGSAIAPARECVVVRGCSSGRIGIRLCACIKAGALRRGDVSSCV